MRANLCLSLVCLMAANFAVDLHAENWPQFRGPHHNGSSTEKNLPEKFSKTENIKWTAELPGSGAATPIVWEDHVFVSSVDKATDTVKAICIDRNTGKILWQKDVDKGIRRDKRSTYAACTPATDGETVIFFYGTGEMVAFNFDGEQQWEHRYGPFSFLWTFSTSPVFFEGKVFLQVLQRDEAVDGRTDGKNESYLLAIDPKTGKTLWKHIRPSKAVKESREAFTTPMPFVNNGRKELVVVGGDALTGHDPETGKELWRWGTWNPERITHWRLVPSPVASEDVILVCAPKREPIYAIRPGIEGKENTTLTDADVAWVSREQRELSSDVPTPSYYDKDFFVLSDVRKTLSRIDPKTGKVKWTMTTPGRDKYEASPTVADGKIYIVNFSGEVTIVNAADGKIINTIAMDEKKGDVVRSAVVVSQGNLFVRTTDKLYCVGK